MRRVRRTFGELSVSALDLFASALGVFILIAILMFPYYLVACFFMLHILNQVHTGFDTCWRSLGLII